MKFRFARHTNSLEKIKCFYMETLGFQLLGNFENHDGYNGIFIGKLNLDWHLEFTQTSEIVSNSYNEDNLIVLYPKSSHEYKEIIKKIKAQKISFIEAKNPYWNKNGKMILDPDGYRIVISMFK